MKGERCDTPRHRKLGHVDGEWVWVSSLFCWRRHCLDCGILVAVAEGGTPNAGE